MEKIIIYGGGGHAAVVIDLVEKTGQYQIEGLIDDRAACAGRVLDYPVLGGGEKLGELRRQGIRYGFVAIGDNNIRRAKTLALEEAGFETVSLIHPFSSVGKETLFGRGSMLCCGAAIDPRVRVGEGCLLNARTAVGHDTEIGDFVHLSGGVTCGAEVVIGENTFIGMGTTVISGLKIGKGVFVGAGSVVTKFLPDHVRAAGVPARIVKSHP